MQTMADILKSGGKKYLPETDYLGEIKLAKLKRNDKGVRLLFTVNIVDTLPEGGMNALGEDLADNEKFPGDERLFDSIAIPDADKMSAKYFDFATEKFTEFMIGCGIVAMDEEGNLSLKDETIDMSEEPQPEWFLDRLIGIQVKKLHHWADREKVKPVEDTIVGFLPIPEEA